MEEIITIDLLTQNSVSVKRQKTIVADGMTYAIGDPHRCAYVNSAFGREQLAEDVPEPYCGAIIAVWGDVPTVSDPEGVVE